MLKKSIAKEVTFENINLCDLCGSNKFKTFLTAPDRNYKTGIFKYVKCSNCKLVWLTPRPTKKALSNFYPTVYRPYRSFHKTTKAQKLVRQLIKSNRFIARILIKDQLFFFEKKGKILDVGPGSGFYLTVLSQWGWDVTGLELSSKAIKVAHKSGVESIVQGDLHTIKFKSSSFDVVRFSHVMEHVPSATEELKEVRRILKKAGKVLIIVPNIESLFFNIFKSYWYPLEAPRHFYQFSEKTITNLLKLNGFKNIGIKYKQPPHTFFWSILYLMGFNNCDKRLGYLLYPLDVCLRTLNIFKKSDLIEVIATKA